MMINRRKKEIKHLKEESNQKLTDDPYIFICITLWQEAQFEMETLIRSLVRLLYHAKRNKKEKFNSKISVKG